MGMSVQDNLLVTSGCLSAVIDFGSMGVGDLPATGSIAMDQVPLR